MLRIQQEGFPQDCPESQCKTLASRKIGPAGSWDPEIIKSVTFNSHMYLSAAEQHLCGLETLLRNNYYGLSVGSLARSAAEAAGRAAWLLDNELGIDRTGTRKRVARLLLDQEDNAKQYKTLAYALEHEDRAQAGDRYRAARDAISKPGMFYLSEIVRCERSGDIELAGEKLPGPSGFVRIAGKIFDHDPIEINASYGYLSAMAHPSLFTLIETLAEVDDSKVADGVIPLREDDRFMNTITWNAVVAFHNSWRAWMSWTNAGMEEVQTFHDMYLRLND